MRERSGRTPASIQLPSSSAAPRRRRRCRVIGQSTTPATERASPARRSRLRSICRSASGGRRRLLRHVSSLVSLTKSRRMTRRPSDPGALHDDVTLVGAEKGNWMIRGQSLVFNEAYNCSVTITLFEWHPRHDAASSSKGRSSRPGPGRIRHRDTHCPAADARHPRPRASGLRLQLRLQRGRTGSVWRSSTRTSLRSGTRRWPRLSASRQWSCKPLSYPNAGSSHVPTWTASSASRSP